MRLLTFDLTAFGPFTETSLDLSGGHEGLHIIYGLNEAGKSAALRALKALFYGMGHQAGDNFLHKHTDLRIGATICGSDNNELAFIRRKGRKNTLLNSEEHPIPDSTLRPYLNNVPKELFFTLFGIDHKALVDGGIQLVAGGGDLGQSLFAAGMGVTGLNDVLRDLQNEAEALFTPTASKRVINSLISRYKEAVKKSSELSLSVREWTNHNKALNEAVTKREKVRMRLNKLRSDKALLDRLNEALPIITERRETLEQLKTLKDVPLLDISFSDERRNSVHEQEKAKAANNKTAEELSLIAKQIKELSIPEYLFSHEKIIGELYKRLGSELKAREDLPGLKLERETLRADAEKILSDLRPGLRLKDAETLHTTETKRSMIFELGAQYPALTNEKERTASTLDELEADLGMAKKSLRKLSAGLKIDGLKSSLRLAQKEGDLEALLAAARARMEKEEGQAQIDLKALPLWKGSLDKLEQLKVPLPETIDLFRTKLEELDGKAKELENRIKETGGGNDNLDKDIKALHIAGAVPTEQELIEARRKRDMGWSLVRKNWIESEDVSKESILFDPGVPLHESYEKSVHLADDVADRLRREAKRVEKLAQLLASREQGGEKLNTLRHELHMLLRGKNKLEKDWVDLWGRISIKPLSPREMSAWHKKWEMLVARRKNIREFFKEMELLKKRILNHHKDLLSSLNRLGEKGIPSDNSINSLMDRCRGTIDKFEEMESQRRHLEKEITEIEKKLLTAIKRKSRAQLNLDNWHESWEKAVSELGLSKETTPSQANAFITKTQNLFEKIYRADELNGRIKNIGRDAEKFEKEVKALLEKRAADLPETSVYDSVETLNKSLISAREDAATLGQLKKQQEEKTQILMETKNTIKEMEEKLSELCRKAGCSSHDDLEKIEHNSEKKRSLKENIRQLETELKRVSHAGGLTTDELIRQAEAVETDELASQIEDAVRDIEEQQKILSGSDKTIGVEQNELGRMAGSGAAAEAAEEAQEIITQIRRHADQYMKLRIGFAILNREIERYREANQNPIIKRAGKIFSELTCMSFSGLKPSYDDKDNPILVGIRPSGEKIRVDGMSDGTCDQLFLSLRLASLEKHMEENGPMPFIIDDILVNFDDIRAEATLRVLAGLSAKTQIIFFTHHAHILSLATKAVPKEVLQVHSL